MRRWDQRKITGLITHARKLRVIMLLEKYKKKNEKPESFYLIKIEKERGGRGGDDWTEIVQYQWCETE